MLLRTCKTCGRPIVFLKTAKGRRCPVNPHTIKHEFEKFDPTKHEAHGDTCPRGSKIANRRTP